MSEFINVSKRILDLGKLELAKHCSSILGNCEIIPLTQQTISKAPELIKRFDFQIFDAFIVASALEGNCNLLYSEDMQHGLKVDGLIILNPFRLS